MSSELLLPASTLYHTETTVSGMSFSSGPQMDRISSGHPPARDELRLRAAHCPYLDTSVVRLPGRDILSDVPDVLPFRQGGAQHIRNMSDF